MSRIEIVQKYVDGIFENISSSDDRKAAFVHTYGVAQCCSLLAKKRKLNPELACVCGLLHDVYSYKTGVHSLHSINGAEMIRIVFKHELKDIFSEEEQIIIKSAIFHHSDKVNIHDEYDEILKNADVLQHWLYDVSNDDFVCIRLIELQKEFGLPISKVSVNTDKEHKSNNFDKALFADVARKLAVKRICGETYDKDFMEIIKYYPEATAFDELTSAWCAAFVYHCVILAGLEIPIRYKPMANTRFACVEAWYEWGKKNNFCFYEKDGFVPSKGDIVIYNNIIPINNKPANTPWYDHIGIVLAVDGENLSVAEANVDNENISGIVSHQRNENIGCYVRIPNKYEYDGLKYDYKTNKVRKERF